MRLMISMMVSQVLMCIDEFELSLTVANELGFYLRKARGRDSRTERDFLSDIGTYTLC